MSCSRFDVTDFRLAYPEFAATSDEAVDAQIERAARLISAPVYGEFYVEAMAALTAHYLAVSAQAVAMAAFAEASGLGSLAVAGNVDTVMEKAGEVQVQMSEALRLAVMRNPFLGTSYGQQYIYWRDLAGMGAVSL